MHTSQNPAARRELSFHGGRFVSETRRGNEKSSICILCIAVARGTDYLSLHVRYRSTKSLQYDMHQYYLVYGKFGEQRMLSNGCGTLTDSNQLQPAEGGGRSLTKT